MDTFVSVTSITMLIQFVCMPLVGKNKSNGEKFYHRKLMWVADEKLIINKLGPNIIHLTGLIIYAAVHTTISLLTAYKAWPGCLSRSITLNETRVN